MGKMWGSEAELTQIDENYIAHGMGGKCQGGSYAGPHCKLEIDPIFYNLRVRHKEEQFHLLLRKGVYPYEIRGQLREVQREPPSPN